MDFRPILTLVGTIALITTASAGSQDQELPPGVSKYLSKQSILRASIRLGTSTPERWLIAYDLKGLARIALVEGDMLTDDKAFNADHTFGNKLSVQSIRTISVPNAKASFLLSLEQEGNRDTKYFSVVTFSPGALDIKLFVSTVSGKAEVLDNPFRVRIWNKLQEPNPSPNQYEVVEYRLLNINATRLTKVQEEKKTSE